MSDMGRDYNHATDVIVPKVTPEMRSKAIKVVLSYAVDASDAKDLLGTLGVDHEDLVILREGSRSG